jgi:predicted nucleic-acid-binding protein
MLAIDTNVLVRYLIEDDKQQTEIAKNVMKAGCYLSLTVLLETVWLLASRYKQPRAAIAEALLQVIQLPELRTVDDALINWVLQRFNDGADFADMVHLVDGRCADAFATFDRAITRAAGENPPMIIEILKV